MPTPAATNTPIDWAALATAPPGPGTLTALTDTDITTLTPAHLLDAITCTERLLSHLAGRQTTLLTEFARPGRAGDITGIVDTLTEHGSAAHTTDGTLDPDLLHILVTDHAHGMAAAEIAAALHISPITARGRVEKAIDLHDGLPATHQALTTGLIDRGRAAVIAEQTDILDPDTRTQVENIVLPLAQIRTAGRLRPLIERAVITADPTAADRRVKKARRTREVTHRPLKDQLNETSRGLLGRLASSGRRVSTQQPGPLVRPQGDRAPAGSPVTGLLMGCRARFGVST